MDNGSTSFPKAPGVGAVSYTHLDVYKRQAMEARRGEERYAAKKLADLGVPIIRTICGSATFEGAMGLWIDRKTIVLASGVRTNREAVSYTHLQFCYLQSNSC